MTRQTLRASLVSAGAALALTTLAVAATAPDRYRNTTDPAQSFGLALAVMLGGVMLPAACAITAAHD